MRTTRSEAKQKLAVLNPQHLLDQAQLLGSARNSRRPRQVDIRRAISASYYAVFHLVLTAIADEFVGKTQRNELRYVLVYRNLDHRTFRLICEEVAKPTVPQRLQKYLPAGGLERNLRSFSDIAVRLQALRHDADYDPSSLHSSVDALFAQYLARTALSKFTLADPTHRKAFLTLLAFPPRGS